MATLTLQPDGTAGTDTSVWSDAATNNYGGRARLDIQAGGPIRKALIEFDLSSIPATATCISATLSVFAGAVGVGTQTWWSIAAGNAAWTEGARDDAQAGAGEPCWNALAADGAGGVTSAWAGSAGLATATTDYETPALGTFATNSEAGGTEFTTALTPARIQGWFGSPNTNYGLLLTTTATDYPWFHSSESATAAYRPKLVVEYMLPLAPANTTHVVTSSSPTLLQTHILAPANTVHLVTSTSPVLTRVERFAVTGYIEQTVSLEVQL